MPEQILLLPLPERETKGSAAMFRAINNALFEEGKSWKDFGVDINKRPEFMTVELRINGVEVSFEGLVSHMEGGLDEAWRDFDREVNVKVEDLLREKLGQFTTEMREWVEEQTESLTSELGEH